jgi:carbonic anhydrase/acetyltransferase-like protein (isoleucine patch superfamily)
MPQTGLILPYRNVLPKVGKDVFVAPSASIIGDVVLGDRANIWFGTVLRGDMHEIRVGARSNIQDNAVVHVAKGRSGTYIGQDVLIGHGAIIHACTIGDGAFIGMGSIILDHAVVEEGAMVAAGAMVTPGKRVKSGELWAGSPAKFFRNLTDEDFAGFKEAINDYLELAADYLGIAKVG